MSSTSDGCKTTDADWSATNKELFVKWRQSTVNLQKLEECAPNDTIREWAEGLSKSTHCMCPDNMRKRDAKQSE